MRPSQGNAPGPAIYTARRFTREWASGTSGVLVNIRLLLLSLAAIIVPISTARARVITPSTPDEFKLLVADFTTMIYDSHGTQVEYNAASGKTYLWYPGNAEIVRGQWKLKRNGKSVDICFKYPAGAASGRAGGDWVCQGVQPYLDGARQRSPGDALELSKAKIVPFVLTREKTSIPALWQKVYAARKR